MTFKEWKLECQGCGHRRISLQWDTDPFPTCEKCGDPLEREFVTGKSATVIGDECDVTVAHGICNPDGTPRRYTSKAEMAATAKALGLKNLVRHQPLPGSDKSPHTSRWT